MVGTTGWYDQLAEVEAAVEESGGAVFWAPNFSIGANALMLLAAEARRLLSRDRFPAAVVETHHAAKRDAPSGTANELAKGNWSRECRSAVSGLVTFPGHMK